MRRVMLKLSGEALSGKIGFGFDEKEISRICDEICKSINKNVQLLIMLGGGNFIRGKMLKNIDKYKADEIGMLSTCMNAIYLSENLRKYNLKTYICGGFSITDMIDLIDKDKIIDKLNNGHIIIFAGGTGSPYFTTDTGVVLRALQLNCDELLLAKSVDGVYDKDPAIHKDAKKYDKLSMKEMVEKKLEVVDITASSMAYENHISMRVFSLYDDENIVKAINGKDVGTYIEA